MGAPINEWETPISEWLVLAYGRDQVQIQQSPPIRPSAFMRPPVWQCLRCGDKVRLRSDKHGHATGLGEINTVLYLGMSKT
jgi:hypothetical protein